MNKSIKVAFWNFLKSPGFYGGLTGVSIGEIMSKNFNPLRLTFAALGISLILFASNLLALWIAIRIKNYQNKGKSPENAP